MAISEHRRYATAMETNQLFLVSDAALRSVVDRLSPKDLATPAPAEWSQVPEPTILDILRAHAYDEAWVPDVLAGASSAEGDDWRDRDLLGDDPITAYDALNDLATAAVRNGVPRDAIFRFQYGDYPAQEGLVHLSLYRGFQAWLIAKHLNIDFHLSEEIIAGMNEHVVPNAEEWRGFGVFPPAMEPPAGADDETRLLCAVGYWIP
ncbi:hypothetical protein [Arthrobacter sp. H35-D1]|uniref:hypothetical protein n=1 Tax=Arthrobacter sp. H35-D1 TaxID=3046202 RepID=UPI0024B9927B|nr:hypothetical protein [Arthrobacter sp. H35-D1]MDJ0314822.1 hypothetical protein [Arthrobacter sp. H35-D1]